MPVPNIVIGQPVDESKILLARKMRREMTPAERLLWTRLRRNQINGLHFRRQQIIRGFIADFYCHAVALVVEVDGPIHDDQKEADAERDQVFKSLGLQVLRVTNDDVFTRLNDVVIAITTLASSDALPRSGEVSGSGPPPRFGEGLGEGS